MSYYDSYDNYNNYEIIKSKKDFLVYEKDVDSDRYALASYKTLKEAKSFIDGLVAAATNDVTR